MLRVEEVAERLRVKAPTVYRWIAGGRLPAVRFSRIVRVREADLEAFLAAGKQAVREEAACRARGPA